MTDGFLEIATMKSVRTSFSPSPTCSSSDIKILQIQKTEGPIEHAHAHSWSNGQRHTHFEVSDEAETLKKVASDSDATALASMVFPVPGGPKRSKPDQ